MTVALTPHGKTLDRLVLLALSGLIYWVSVFSVGANINPSDLVALLCLITACIPLIFIGHGVVSLVTQERIPHICALAIGEICCMSYLMIRSCVSGLAFFFVKIQLPVTIFETLFGLVLVGVFSFKRHAGSSAARPTLKNWAGFGALLFCALGPVVFRELPRNLALSSDPDQHAFWASAVTKLGIVPWDQGLIGSGPFGYPAGFAALNAIWMAFSGLSAVEIVTLQPQIQFILAMLLSATCAQIILRRSAVAARQRAPQTNEEHSALICLICVLLYWLILPYSLQSERIHGEGTPRLSCSLMAMCVLLIWMFPTKLTNRKHINLALLVLAMGVASLVSVINPISASLSMAVTTLILGRFILGLFNHKQLNAKSALYICASFLLPCLIILGEPYIVDMLSRFFGFSFFESSANSHEISQTGPRISFSFNSPLTWILPGELFSYLFAGTRRLTGFLELTSTIVLFALATWFVKTPAIATRWFVALTLCSLTSWMAFNIGGSGDARSPLYLIKPYLHETALQNGALLGFVLLSFFSTIASFSRYRSLFCVAGLLGSLAFIFAQEISPATRLKAFNLTPRECHNGAGGCLSNAELAALKFISSHTSEIRRRYPNLTYADAPKILILGHPVVRGPEKWVFPSGISRVVALHSKVPVAFFYGRGDPAWNHENYLTKVCKKLDLSWLRNRNIRFLVMGNRDPGCMSHRRDVVRSSETIFEMDGVRVLKMF